MVDSADHERVDGTSSSDGKVNDDSAKSELGALLDSDELRGAALLVFANKQDVQGAMKPADMAAKLGLNKIRDRAWYVQGCSATTGDGLYEGFDWLSATLNKQP